MFRAWRVMVCGLHLKVKELSFRVKGYGLRVQSSGFTVRRSGSRVESTGEVFRGKEARHRVLWARA